MDFSLATLLGVAECASVWANIGAVALRVLIVLLGVNMLVIVHEWGHFIVARMCGVRCDKFYIWFDAYGFKFFSFKRGNTEYGLGWLPLGGYVKMYGQEDNPGGIQAEIDKAKIELTEKESELTSEEKHLRDEQIAKLETQLYAPDSYLSKNVFQRMAIISAGVFMNIVFAIICATCAVLIGTPETSAKIGYVAPGSPAWQAGLQAGDQIVGINDDKKPIFSSILVACMDGKEINFDVVKGGSTEPIAVPIVPRVDKGALTPMIGVGPSPALELAETKDRQPYSVSLDGKQAAERIEKLGALKGGERIVSMNGTPVQTPADYIRLSNLYIDRPIEFVFAPTVAKSGGERVVDETKDKITLTIDPVPMREIGVRLTMGEIVAIQPGSVAEKCGLRAQEVDANGEIIQHGDVILDVDNEPVLDPLTFPYQIFCMTGKETFPSSNSDSAGTAQEKGGASRSIVLTVNREGKRVDVPVTLPRYASYTGSDSSRGMLACGALGVAYEVQPIISGTDGSVTFEGNPVGAQIIGFETKVPNPGANATAETKDVFKTLTGKKVSEFEQGALVDVSSKVDGKTSAEISESALSWFTGKLPYLPVGAPVVVKARANDGTEISVNTTVQDSDSVYMSARGLYVSVDAVFQRADSFGSALSFGVSKTIESAAQVFIFLKNVGKNVSAKALGGPGMIVGTAYEAAGRKDGVFLLFLCLISANLAVVNFLPIPVLDGGHMVFLLYEAITRRKPNENLQIALSWVGFILILGLMCWVIFLDVLRYCF